MKRYRRHIILFAIVAAFLGWLFDPFQFSAARLPEVSDITSIEARTFQSRDDDGHEKPFFISEANWGSVIKSLQPAERDYFPSKWIMIGELIIT